MDDAGSDTTPMDNPDDKDWTWVLESTCPECEYDVRDFDRAQIGSMIRANARDWAVVLDQDEALLRARKEPDKWSTLEYAFHVRDVFELYHFRLALMLDEQGPHYPNWDQDAAAVEKNYGGADAVVVSNELLSEAEKLASRFDDVQGEQWDRTGFRSDGAAFTVDSFARYLIHDPVHHLWDVTV